MSRTVSGLFQGGGAGWGGSAARRFNKSGRTGLGDWRARFLDLACVPGEGG